MADKARPYACPCTDPNHPEFEWVSTEDPIAVRVLKALHTDKGILTGEECSECASKKWGWNELAAIVVATKTTDDVQRALDVVRQQFTTGVHAEYMAKEFARLLQVLSTLYQEKMLTEQEMEELKQADWPWDRLVMIQCTKPPDVVKRTAELLAEVGRDEEGKQLKVLSTLYQEKMLTEQEMEKLKPLVWDRLVQIQCTKPPDVVKRTAELLAEVGRDEDGDQLKVLSTLYQEKMLTEQEKEVLKQATSHYDHLVQILCTKPPDVVKRTAELLAEVGRHEQGKQLKVLSTLYQEKMLTKQEMEELKPLWNGLVVIQCTKPPDVVKRSAEMLAEVGRNEEGKQLKVLAALYQKKVIAEHDLQKLKSASDIHLDLVFDLCTRPSEDVATAADVLDMVGWKNEAVMLRVLSVLYQKKVLAHHEVMEMRHEMLGHVPRTDEALWQELVNVQCRKPPEVVTATAEVLDELGLKEEATQLRVLSELYQKGLISEDDLRDLPHHHYMMGHSSGHWLDSLVDIQSSKSSDVHARTFDTLKSFSLTEVVQERQTKHTESTTSDPLETVLPSSAMTSSSQQYPTKTLASPQTLSEHPLAKKSPLTSTPREVSVSPPKTKVSSLQTGEGSDPPEIEGASDIETDEAALKRLCWIPFGIKTVSIKAKGGFLCLEPSTEILQGTKEDTIFVEVPPDAVSTSADVKMRYAIIPSGPFTLPEGYQFGSPVVYIYYDGQRVTKPLTLHLPHWYGGEDHARDGLSFAVASHSLNRGSVYDFQPLAGGKFPGSSHYGLVEIHGHCSLYAQVFDLGATTKYLATFLVKEERGKTECNIAVTYSSPLWAEILQQRYRRGWKVSKHDMFQFKQDRITATLKDSCHVHGDWRADFIGTSEILPSDVQYDCHSIASHELLETAVKNSSYPPAIKCIVKYRKELKRTGTPTVVELHISGVDRKMEFQCPAYERIQADPPPPTLGSAQTDITSQPSLSVWEAALLPPTPVSTAQSTYSGAAHTLSLCPPQSVASSSVSPTPLSPAQCSPTGTAGSLSVCSPTTRVASLSPARFPPTQAENTLSVCSPHSEASSSVSPSHLSLTHSTQAETSSDLSVCPPYNRPTPVAPPPHTPGSSPTMNLWNKEALKSMREELGGVCMKDPGMIKRLEKSVICSPANPTLGFLSETQLQVVESKMTPTEKMNMVIDFLVEMEDKYFEYFCKILDRSNFKVKAKMLRDKAEELKISFEAQAAAKISDIPPPPGDDSNGSSTGSPSYIS